MTSLSEPLLWYPLVMPALIIALVLAGLRHRLLTPPHEPKHLLPFQISEPMSGVTVIPPRPYDYELDGDGWPER